MIIISQARYMCMPSLIAMLSVVKADARSVQSVLQSVLKTKSTNFLQIFIYQ